MSKICLYSLVRTNCLAKIVFSWSKCEKYNFISNVQDHDGECLKFKPVSTLNSI